MAVLPNAVARCRAGLLALPLALFGPVVGVAAAEPSGGPVAGGLSLTVEGISASTGEDNPRVLYILPWQAPSLPRRPRADLKDQAPELVQPIDPTTLERHRVFRNTLNPLVLSPGRDSAVTTQ